jgi:hypothetical protein
MEIELEFIRSCQSAVDKPFGPHTYLADKLLMEGVLWCRRGIFRLHTDTFRPSV